jgi:hypothetical protein
MQYSCTRQLADGSWWYAEAPKYHWIDNFHTGYNLDSLKCYIENTGDQSYDQTISKGLEFYKRHFFEPDGCPRYYHNRTQECLGLAKRVALWTIGQMQDPDGHFYYRSYALIKAKTPMLHWAQATTYKALALLLGRTANRREVQDPD